MLAVFFLGTLVADWMHLGVLTGLSFVVGAALAARYTRRDGLLTVVVTPPLIFMIALVVTEVLTQLTWGAPQVVYNGGIAQARLRYYDADRGRPGLPPDVAAGRRLFFTERDGRISRDGRACGACHPEGRDDGLTWKLGAGPRQTPTLLGRLDRGPFGWQAKHARLEDNMRETMTRRQFDQIR